jgi:hypothetical protein
MQGTIPHRGFYVINLHDLKGSFSVVPADERKKLWRDFWIPHIGGIKDQIR